MVIASADASPLDLRMSSGRATRLASCNTTSITNRVAKKAISAWRSVRFTSDLRSELASACVKPRLPNRPQNSV